MFNMFEPTSRTVRWALTH